MKTINNLIITALAFGTFTGAQAQEYQSRDKICLAEAVYHEARGEPLRGQYAVANVVMNRVKSRNYPNTVCGVVHQCGPRGCQFSWARKYTAIPSGRTWEKSLEIAEKVLNNQVEDHSNGARYFATKYVIGNGKRTTAIIGSHIFKK